MAASPLRREPVQAARPSIASAALRASTIAFRERCRAQHAELAAREAERDAEAALRGSSPAMAAAEASFRDHAAEWAQARRDALAGTGCPDAPIRDRGLSLRDPEPIRRRFLNV